MDGDNQRGAQTAKRRQPIDDQLVAVGVDVSAVAERERTNLRSYVEDRRVIRGVDKVSDLNVVVQSDCTIRIPIAHDRPLLTGIVAGIVPTPDDGGCALSTGKCS